MADHDGKDKQTVTAVGSPDRNAPGSPNDRYNGGMSTRRQGALERYITSKPAVAFGLTLQASWEGVAVSLGAALLNGGPVSLIYGQILTSLGSIAMAMSLGEMASIDPVVGAQYRWTTLYAPRFMKPEFWGYLQGWLTVFAWLAACALTTFLLGSTLQALIAFNYQDTYVFQSWHTTLLTIAFSLFLLGLNVFARRILVVLEIIGGTCHFLFFIVTVTVLGVMARRSTDEFVWTTIVTENSGWTNPCAAFSIGLLTVAFPVSGFDGVLHMSAEIKDPHRRVPRSMVAAVALNSVFAFAFIICVLYCIGDFKTASKSLFPIIDIYYMATGSVAGTNVLVLFLLFIIVVSAFSIFASVSRLIWAFARDNGLPFSDFFAHIHPKLHIPFNTVCLVTICCCLLSLINIASTTAFYAIVSLSTLSLYISYIIPITLVLIRKLEGRHPKYGPFHLGKWGIPINLFAILYGCYLTVFLAFPVYYPVDRETMNYAAPLWLACFVIAVGCWFIFGHKKFNIPVKQSDPRADEN